MKHLNLIKEIFSEGFTGLMDNAGESEKTLQGAETEFYGFMVLAPEMLAMLKELHDNDDVYYKIKSVGARARLRKLIAKAEGGDPGCPDYKGG